MCGFQDFKSHLLPRVVWSSLRASQLLAKVAIGIAAEVSSREWENYSASRDDSPGQKLETMKPIPHRQFSSFFSCKAVFPPFIQFQMYIAGMILKCNAGVSSTFLHLY